MIRAGTMQEINPDSGQWVIADLGFSQSQKSCGLVVDDGEPEVLTFAELCERVTGLVRDASGPVNLLLEAPLSVAFTAEGNPTGRGFEKRDSQTRYWYVGLGCSVLVAAMYLLRRVADSEPSAEIRLFEALVSFKDQSTRSSHINDVLGLREAIRNPQAEGAQLIAPDKLAAQASHRLESAFLVAGMDFGVPPVVVATPAIQKSLP